MAAFADDLCLRPDAHARQCKRSQLSLQKSECSIWSKFEENSNVQEQLTIMETFALFHPGEMGAALGAALASRGFRVLWASQGRSAQTTARAKAAALEDACTIEHAVKAAEVVISVCPPHAALSLAREAAADGFGGIYVDANAISPATAREIGRVIEAAGGTFVDGGIIGPPPTSQKQPTLYLSGAQAATIAALFTGTNIHAEVIDGGSGAASALKMCYAAFTKGTTALLAAVRALAEHEGVEGPLLESWRHTLPDVPRQSEHAAAAAAKAWRWSGEMEEIAASFGAAGLPDGFHRAAAEIYRRLERFKNRTTPPSMAEVTRAMKRSAPVDPASVTPDVNDRVNAKTLR
jgi:3-hydroxyisobutyrate dehydrogenase-like beta-hydroxyacid dehydrogenase